MQQPRRKPLLIGFILANRFTMSAFASFADVVRLASDEDDKSRRILCDWDVLSHDMDMIRSSGGFKIQPDTRLRNARAYDYIVVVGGLIGDGSNLAPEMLRYLHDQAARGVPIVGLCTGVFILQEAGLLKGYRCCVNWFHHQEFVDRFENERPVSDQIFVVDRDRLTCSGGHGSAHMAAYIIARHIGDAAAAKSLNIMTIDRALSAERPQPAGVPERSAQDPLVKRCMHLMNQNLEVPKSIEALAETLNVGRRTLERRFRIDTGDTPSEFYRDLRLNRAVDQLRRSGRSVAEVAVANGFCDASHLSRSLRDHKGMTAGQIRETALRINK